MTTRRHFLLAPGALLLAQCGGPPPPAKVDIMIKAAADQNPDASGKPVAVAVRIYSLTAAGKFNAADVYALVERVKATLGEEGAGMEEVVMRPDSSRTVNLSPRAGVHHIGVAVLFRDIDRAKWQAIAPIATSGLTRLNLSISGNKAVLVAA